MKKISKYFRGVAEEARRIRWPNQKLLWKSVAIVLTIAIVSALFIVLSDFLTLYINRGFSNAFSTSTSSTISSSSVSAAMRVLFSLI